jgi:tetratricopeptide (TPR) repeat protein
MRCATFDFNDTKLNRKIFENFYTYQTVAFSGRIAEIIYPVVLEETIDFINQNLRFGNIKKRLLLSEKFDVFAMKSKIILFILIISINYSNAQKAEKLIDICEEFHLLGQTDSVKKYSKTILQKPKSELSESIESQARFFMAHAIQRTFPDSSYKILQKVNRDFQTQNDTKFLAFVSASLGTYNRKIGNFEQAIKFHNQAIEFAEKYYGNSDNRKLNRIIALQYNSISILNFEKSEYELSNQYALKAVKLGNQYDFKHIELGSTIILGNIQMHFKQMDLAEKSFSSARELSIKINDNYRLGVSLSNLGIINLLKLEANDRNSIAYKKAKQYFNEALKIAENQNDYTGISARYSNLANVENAAKNYQNANDYLKNALKYAQLSKSKVLSLQVTTTLSRNYLNLGSTKNAIELANEGLKLSEELSNEKEKPSLYGILNQAYTKEKDFVKALEYQKAQMESKDSLYQTSITDKITELQTKYETEKKQRAIELLTAQNQAKEAEIKQKNYLILATVLGFLILIGAFLLWYRERIFKQKQQNAEMEQRLLRAQLNPHFLFNSLNSIQRLYVDGKMGLANDFIADFAQLMRDILDKTSKTKIPLYEEIEFIENYLSIEKRRLGDKFEYEVVIDDEIRNSDIEVPSFILQPLVENALLHGVLPKNQRGKIQVLVDKSSDESLSITVRDDGVGFYQSLQKSGKHTSKGMELIKSRLGKKGRMLIEEIKNTTQEVLGTKIILELAQ